MQPSGPVPAVAAVATGSGPHDDAAKTAPAKTSIAIPANAAEALAAWNLVLDELETLKKFSLSGPFSHARVMKWTFDTIELGFPIDVHAMGEMAADADKLLEMRTIVRELGPELKNIKLAVRLLDERESASAGARSLLETTRDKSTAEKSRREAEAREHPITKHVLQTFGAQIKEIKTDV
jgi:RNase H-fold protein (predicted Holliday junction resolvase)